MYQSFCLSILLLYILNLTYPVSPISANSCSHNFHKPSNLNVSNSLTLGMVWGKYRPHIHAHLQDHTTYALIYEVYKVMQFCF
jgi:hypothetical protein